MRPSVYPFLLALFCAGSFLHAQTIFYVDGSRGTSGDGSSWAEAFQYLDDAIELADDGDQVWVAAGTYVPGGDAPARETSFEFDDNIQLYGGFSGSETALSQRDIAANPTVLSGDALGDDVAFDFRNNLDDNAMHIMVVEAGTSTACIIDGFTFTRGKADYLPVEEVDGAGGAILAFGACTIRNCTFRQNYAIRGAAIFIEEDAASGLQIIDCEFSDHRAQQGSAIYATEMEDLVIEGCLFQSNRVNDNGGAIYLDDADEFTISDCEFRNNLAGETFALGDNDGSGGLDAGGAVYCTDADGSITECTIEFGRARRGGAFANGGEGEIALEDVTFGENNGIETGGATYLYEFSTTGFNDCDFAGNTAARGGAMHVQGGVMVGDTITTANLFDCELEGNVASMEGGAIWSQYGAEVTVEASELTGNSTGGAGGAILIGFDPLDLGNTYVVKSRVYSNTSDGPGGAFAVVNGELEIVNSIVAFNAAGTYGGSVAAFASDTFNTELLQVNSTFYRNTAETGGDELAVNMNGDDAEVEVEFLNNLYDVSDSFYEAVNGEPTFESLGGNVLTDDTDEPIFTDPTDQLDVSEDGLFVDADNFDFQLAMGSVAINAGVIEDDTPDNDIEGALRDDNPDSGAYEYQGSVSTRQPDGDLLAITAQPNPTTGLVRLKGAAVDAPVRVVSGTGQVLRDMRLSAGQLDLQGLPSGMYSVVVEDQVVRVVVR